MFSGDVGKTAVKKVLENYQKSDFSSIHFKKFEPSKLPTYKYTKTGSTANTCFVCFEDFNIGWRAHVVKLLFSKVTETSGFCNSVEKSNSCMGCSEK